MLNNTLADAEVIAKLIMDNLALFEKETDETKIKERRKMRMMYRKQKRQNCFENKDAIVEYIVDAQGRVLKARS